MSNKIRNVNPYDPCPCGNKRKAKFCCFVKGQWLKQPQKIMVLDNGFNQHPKCYAKELNNCSQKISKEHYISASVQKQLEFNGGVTVFGQKFLGSQLKTLPISSLASNILCETHNNALSPLDTQAGNFFRSSLNIVLDYNSCPDVTVFSGEDIELWLLKTVLGIISSQQTQVLSWDGLSTKSFEFPQNLVDILFKRVEWPNDWGLYMSDGILPSNGHFLFNLHVENEMITGAHIRFCAKEFFLNLGAKDITAHLFDFPKVNNSISRIYRPERLSYHKDEISKHVLLTWKNKVNKLKRKFMPTHIDCYHMPDSKMFPPQDISPLLELMNEPKEAAKKYLQDSSHEL